VRQQRMAAGAVLELDLSDPQQFVAYLTRRYQHDLVALIIKLLPRSGVFVDVGANIGLISFSIAARRPDVSVLAFEPEPANAARWLRNADLNNARATRLERVALGSEFGIAEMVRRSESGQSHIAVGGEHGAPVAVDTLDSCADRLGLKKIDVLKVDVEGYEPLVLRGAATLFEEKRIAAIVCEMNDALLRRTCFTRSKLIASLERHGFTPQPIPATGARRFRSQPTIENAGDVLFINSAAV
jgi:FkbM family methyltransferase